MLFHAARWTAPAADRRTKELAMRTPLLLLVLLPLAFVDARAQCVTHNTECVLPLDCFPWQWNGSVSFGASYEMQQLTVANPSTCTAFPPLGDSIDASFDADAGIFSLTDFYHVGTAHVTVHETTTADNGTDKTISLEMLAMNIAGGTFPAGMAIRESPTLASTGQAATEPSQVGNGRDVNVDFNLVLELTKDGGQTWIPASAPIQLIFYQSTPVRDLTWGGLKATYR